MDDVLTEADIQAAIEALRHPEPSSFAPIVLPVHPLRFAEFKALLKLDSKGLNRIGIYESHNLVSGK